jgi:DNA-directed RNA polymerase specialized sigma24 family protein
MQAPLTEHDWVSLTNQAYEMAARLASHPSQAEDLAQEALLRWIKIGGRYGWDRRVLRKIIRRLNARWWNQEWARKKKERIYSHYLPRISPWTPSPLPSSPKALEVALAALPQEEREVIQAHFGMDAAETVGPCLHPKSSYYNRLKKALHRLRRSLVSLNFLFLPSRIFPKLAGMMVKGNVPLIPFVLPLLALSSLPLLSPQNTFPERDLEARLLKAPGPLLEPQAPMAGLMRPSLSPDQEGPCFWSEGDLYLLLQR